MDTFVFKIAHTVDKHNYILLCIKLYVTTYVQYP